MTDNQALDVLDELAFVLHGQGCGEVCVCVDDARALLPTVRALMTAAEARGRAEVVSLFDFIVVDRLRELIAEVTR